VISTSEAFFCSSAVRTANVTDGGVCEVHSKQVLIFVRKYETIPKCTQNPQGQNIHGAVIIRRTVNHSLGSWFKTEHAAFHACTCRCAGQKKIVTSVPMCTEECISLVFRTHRRHSRKDYCIVSKSQNSWLQIQRTRVWFPALPDFLRSSVSGMRSTQPREDNWGATLIEK
jgi:hypothetical protein